MNLDAPSTATIPDSPGQPRGDRRAILGGVLFSLAFTGLIWWAGGRLEAIRLLPDQGADWYYWRLPEPTFWTRASAWGLYLLHQISIWGLIYFAQSRRSRYTTSLHRFNVLALAANAFFIAAHFAQTHLLYDGLAQDVSIWSSQASVVVLLVMVLIMENQRRGLAFGKRAPLPAEAVRLVRKYHGYLFAWAAIYTFWYHPMVATPGHLIGFAYMFLLMLQGSLFYTRIHVNRYWTFVQEIAVLFHGTLVAVQQGNGLWPMFLFGFGGVFVITQMHGLGLSSRLRLGILALYVAGVAIVYSGRGLAQVNEVIRIPLIEYLAAFVIAWLIGGALWLVRAIRGSADRAVAGKMGQ